MFGGGKMNNPKGKYPVLPEFFSLKLHFLKATGESGCSFLQTYTRP